MKIILSIFCAVLALFGGGCALMLGNQAGPLVLLPLAILALNGLIFAALWGWKEPLRWVFYLLGAIDLLIAAGITYFLAMLGPEPTIDAPTLAVLMVFAAKGVLTLYYCRTMEGP